MSSLPASAFSSLLRCFKAVVSKVKSDRWYNTERWKFKSFLAQCRNIPAKLQYAKLLQSRRCWTALMHCERLSPFSAIVQFSPVSIRLFEKIESEGKKWNDIFYQTGPTIKNGPYHFLKFHFRIPYVSEIYWREEGLALGGSRRAKKRGRARGKKNEGGLKKYWTVFNSILSPICCSLLTWFDLGFSARQFRLFTFSLSLQRLDILDFSCCPLSRVLPVALANRQRFGFEFHLRSSPSAFSGYGWSLDQLITSLLACYTVLTRPNKVETADHGCNSWLSVWTLSCRCPVKLST